MKIHCYLYAIIPFTFIVILNVVLLHHLYQNYRVFKLNKLKQVKKKSSITITIISMTFLFIVFTSPGAFTSKYYSNLVSSTNGHMIILFCDCFCFSYHGLNIIILCFTNKRFFRQLKTFFKNKRVYRYRSKFNLKYTQN